MHVSGILIMLVYIHIQWQINWDVNYTESTNAFILFSKFEFKLSHVIYLEFQKTLCWIC